MKLIIKIFTLQLLTLSSCSDRNKAKFEVTNATSFEIDSLYFHPGLADDTKYISLQPQQTKTYYLDMAKQTTDGAYGIFFKSKQENRAQIFGYYSNGIVMEVLTKIKIERDTILITEVHQ